MSKKIDDILEEIHENATEDRGKLVEVRNKIVESFDPNDIMAKTAVADNVSRLSDSLARVNQQLLEIAKIRLKGELAAARKGEKDDEEDHDAMFDEIGDGFREEDEKDAN